jgi:hypothetical protein
MQSIKLVSALTGVMVIISIHIFNIPECGAYYNLATSEYRGIKIFTSTNFIGNWLWYNGGGAMVINSVEHIIRFLVQPRYLGIAYGVGEAVQNMVLLLFPIIIGWFDPPFDSTDFVSSYNIVIKSYR